MNLELAQALYTIRRLPGEDLPRIAADLLASGVDSPALRELAGLNRPTLRDAGELFETVLANLNASPMTRDRAAEVIAMDLARQVVSGTLSPRDAAGRGASYCHDFNYRGPLIRFLALDDDYDCDHCAGRSIDQDVIAYARELLSECGRDAG